MRPTVHSHHRCINLAAERLCSGSDYAVSRHRKARAMRRSSVRIFRFMLMTLALSATSAAACGHSNPPGSADFPTISYVPLPIRSPVPLTVKNLDAFVSWIATMPASQIPDVKKAIAKARNDSPVVDAVANRLSFTHPGSYDQQLIYLSILGQMGNPRALPALNGYVYSRECPVYEESVRVTALHDATQFDTCAGLKSRAISMIAFINTPAAQNLVLKAIEGHPSRAVRLSAIDAFLYENHDSRQAIALLVKTARPSDKMFVGLPRLAPQNSLRAFDAAVARFYHEHPEERAKIPKRVQK